MTKMAYVAVRLPYCTLIII